MNYFPIVILKNFCPLSLNLIDIKTQWYKNTLIWNNIYLYYLSKSVFNWLRDIYVNVFIEYNMSFSVSALLSSQDFYIRVRTLWYKTDL